MSYPVEHRSTGSKTNLYGPKAGKGNNMYRVWRVLRDEYGNIVHKTPVGCARSERGARALIAGQFGECIIEKLQ